MSSNHRIERGRRGERLAAEHLARAGYRVVERNFRTRYGELDLIACDDRALVFCEVKTLVDGARTGPRVPLEAISPRKRRRLRSMAAQWLASRPAEGRARGEVLRFDAIAITLGRDGEVMQLEHLENAC
jgi:putative endonuclease